MDFDLAEIVQNFNFKEGTEVAILVRFKKSSVTSLESRCGDYQMSAVKILNFGGVSPNIVLAIYMSVQAN